MGILKKIQFLGENEVNRPGKYLGMPMTIGRQKKMLLFVSFLIDRIGQRQQGDGILKCCLNLV